MRYDKIDHKKVDEANECLRDEIEYARRQGVSSVPVELFSIEALGALLDDLAEIAMHAPGGHGFQMDEARRWAALFNTPAPQQERTA